MTWSEYLTRYRKSFSYPGTHCAMIFHYDPILEVVESRAIYSEARVEVAMWLEEKMEFYRNHKIDFTAYIDGIFEGTCGDINQYIKEEE